MPHRSRHKICFVEMSSDFLEGRRHCPGLVSVPVRAEGDLKALLSPRERSPRQLVGKTQDRPRWHSHTKGCLGATLLLANRGTLASATTKVFMRCRELVTLAKPNPSQFLTQSSNPNSECGNHGRGASKEQGMNSFTQAKVNVRSRELWDLMRTAHIGLAPSRWNCLGKD